MSDSDLRTLVEQLATGLDFGEYALSVYLAVLEAGELTAPELARRTDVPKTRVYDTARDLADRGLVEIYESRPMRVAATNPADAFDGFQASFDALVDELEDRYVEPGLGTEAVSLVTTRQSILRHLDDVVSAANFELSLSVPTTLLDRLEPLLREQIDDGVHVNLIVFPRRDAPDTGEYDYTSVATVTRAREGVTTPVVAVADGERSVYASREAVEHGTEQYGVIFNQSTLGFLVYGFYTTMLWTTGPTIASREQTEPFPRQYASIRRCVEDLQGTRGPFHAAVTGRDVQTGQSCDIEGRVLDTTLDMASGVASLTLESEDEQVSVGGRVAAFEDIEAHHILVERS